MYDNTDELVAEIAAIAAVEVAQIQEARQATNYNALVQGQAETSAIEAVRALTDAYGEEEVHRYWPAMQARLSENPIPQDKVTSPTAFANALHDTFRLAKGETDAQANQSYWSDVVAKDVPPVRVGRIQR